MMMSHQELLYSIFENHLFGLHTSNDITTDDFVNNVVGDYLFRLTSNGIVIPLRLRQDFEDEIKEDVLEMTRKKTYGHLSIGEFRLKNADFISRWNRRS